MLTLNSSFSRITARKCIDIFFETEEKALPQSLLIKKERIA
jgi:hypothetical protein